MSSDRRRFLRTVALGSAALAAAGKTRASSLFPRRAENILTVPDLKDGFLVFKHDGADKQNINWWYTSVQCVLERKSPGRTGAQRAYLGQECRAELVGPDPFGHPGNYEWAGISTWNGNYHLRSGPGNQPEKVYEKMAADLTIEVTCPDRQARRLAFEETIHLLQSDFRDGYKQLYLAATYHLGGYEYRLSLPVRYISFPHPEKAILSYIGPDKTLQSDGLPHPEKAVVSYLQPIQGYVLYEENGRFYTAYMVAWIERGQTKPRQLQFKVRDQVVYGETVTHDFNRTVRIDDDRIKMEFFIYE